MFNAFVSMYEVAFCTTNGQNETLSYDTEHFVSVAILCGIVGSQSWFTKFWIGRTRDILSDMYINEKSQINLISQIFTETYIACQWLPQ